jgi:predicted transposase/invertase (TIGR01784 family)
VGRARWEKPPLPGTLWVRDFPISLISTGKEEGIKLGEEKGKEEKAKETAKRMLNKGFDFDTIVEITGLEPSEVEKLREVTS